MRRPKSIHDGKRGEERRGPLTADHLLVDRRMSHITLPSAQNFARGLTFIFSSHMATTGLAQTERMRGENGHGLREAWPLRP
jgi:hypothetical protein